MAKNINFKVQKKFEKVFKNIPNIPQDIPLQHEMRTILNLMQEMYELGFADGYAEGIMDVKKKN